MAWLVFGLVLLAVSCNAGTLKALHETVHSTHGQDGHDHAVHLCSAYFNLRSADLNPPREACVDGSTKKISCNTCTCLGGNWACTKMACSEDLVPVPLINTGRCVDGTVKMEKCNTCNCLDGIWACTLMACIDDPRPPIRVPGKNGSMVDVICDHRNAKNFIVCTLDLKNRSFAAVVEHCDEGLVFDERQKICSPKMPTPCPSWVNEWHDKTAKDEKDEGKVDQSAPAAAAIKMPPKPPVISVADHLLEGQHSCIDCKLDKCHKCICDQELKTSWKEMAYKPEPYSHGERFLVCYENRITCHPCPKGLVWDCEHETCSTTSNCPDIPEACWCDCGRAKPKKTVTTVTTATITTVTTTTVTVTSTTSTIHPSGAIVPTGGNTLIKKYKTTTESVCVTTDIVSGKEMEMPCKDVVKPISTTTTDTKTSRQARTVTSPTSNTTTITTEDNCSGTTTSTTTKLCPDACPAMTTTIAVGPCVSDVVVPAPTKPPVHPVTTRPDCPDCDITPLQRCLCKEAVENIPHGQSSALLCDPHSDDRFLVCQRDEVVCESCASGHKWNYVTGACDLVRQCKPIPQCCAHLLS